MFTQFNFVILFLIMYNNFNAKEQRILKKFSSKENICNDTIETETNK